MDTTGEMRNETGRAEESARRRMRTKIGGGILLLGCGGMLLLKQLGASLPAFLFTWPMLLVIAGIFLLVRSAFCAAVGYMLVFSGALLVANQQLALHANAFELLLAIGIIIAGVSVLFYSRRPATRENIFHSSLILGSVKRTVISKSFGGGFTRSILGGTDIDLTQAEFTGEVSMHLNLILSGVTLRVPADWEVRTGGTVILSAVEDQREIRPNLTMAAGKVLVLKGRMIMSNVEINTLTAINEPS
jgi:hypothetical protein